MGHAAKGAPGPGVPAKKSVSQGLLNSFKSYGTRRSARVAASGLGQPMGDGVGLRLSGRGRERSRTAEKGLVEGQG